MTAPYVHPHQAKARLFIDAPLQEESMIAPAAGQMHYLLNVMRCQAGDSILVFNGREGEWRAELELQSKKKCALMVREQTRAQRAEPDIWLLFAPVKRLRLDFLVQKAAELGVSRVWPVKTAFTQVARINGDRLQANVIEAAEQSDRLSVPQIGDYAPLAKVLDDWSLERKILFCDESLGEEQALPAAQVLSQASSGAPPGPWAVLIGPEGGFSESERKMLRAHDFVFPVGLGPRILRADTAAIAILTLWQAMLGDW